MITNRESKFKKINTINVNLKLIQICTHYEHSDKVLLVITFKKKFDFLATDNELGSYISSMLEVVEGDIDPQIEFDVESDESNRYVIINVLEKSLH